MCQITCFHNTTDFCYTCDMIQYLVQLHEKLFFSLFHIGRNPRFHTTIIFIADTMVYPVLLLAVFSFFYFLWRAYESYNFITRIQKAIYEGFAIFFSITVAWGVSYIIKITVKSARPFLRYPNIQPLFIHGGYDSFPSGHATLFMALATMIFLYHRKVGILFILFAILISIGRVIAGVHFPIDIITGWIIGGIVSFVVYRGMK